ncbi:hypothetical protein ACFYMB_02545 [Micromonospora haikouensis]|uniref:hypothetical protein n=1 Tax=Micromonospora haikouensis TaxID=686309 RepID=UPI0036896EDE
MLFPTAAGGSRPPEDPATRRGADRRLLRRGALVAAVALLAALVPPPAPAGAAPSPGAAASGRYYVVGPPVAGQREYLYQIAARTLGSGDRYREIFDLNRDRPQPDGGRLTDPAELRPGWVLELPADARGPGVRTGAVPTVAATATPARPDPAPPRRPGHLAGGAGLAAVALLFTALLLAALLLAALLLATRARRATRVRRRARRPDALTSRPPRLALTAAPAAADADTAEPPTAQNADATEPPATADGDVVRPSATPPPATDGDLRTEVTSAAGTLTVRVSGAAPGAGQTRYAWYAPELPRPAMRLPVRLGDRQGWALWVDLAGVPDVFTVTGPPGAASRHARELAEQVHAAGHTVTVVGDLFGADLPDGCVHRPDFPTDEAGLPEGVGVLLSGGLSGPELAFARQVAALTGHRLVPVVVGRALRARWSVTTRDAAAGEVDGSPGRPGGGPVGELSAAGGEP